MLRQCSRTLPRVQSVYSWCGMRRRADITQQRPATLHPDSRPAAAPERKYGAAPGVVPRLHCTHCSHQHIPTTASLHNKYILFRNQELRNNSCAAHLKFHLLLRVRHNSQIYLGIVMFGLVLSSLVWLLLKL